MLPEGAKFCLNCGTKVEEVSAVNLACNGCGEELPEGAKFCLNCGTKVGETPDEEVGQ